MLTNTSGTAKPRVAFLFLLATAISLLFFWVIEGFVLPVFLAAVFAGMLQPIYYRILSRTRGHRSLASAITVGLSFVVVIVPLVLLLGLISSEAIQISESATDWVETHGHSSEALKERLAAHPQLQRLLPYQEQLVDKLSESVAKIGGWIATGLAAGVKGTAAF